MSRQRERSFAVAVKQGFLETRRVEPKSLNFTTCHYSNAARMDRETAETLAERYDGEVIPLRDLDEPHSHSMPGCRLQESDDEKARAAQCEQERIDLGMRIPTTENNKVPQIYAQLSRVMADIGSVSKDRKNEQQKYSFRGIEDFYQAAHPAMIKHGVFCAPEVLERTEYRFEKTSAEYNKTTVWLHVVMKVRHRFYAEDGSFVDVTTCGEGLDNSDKASNKAMSGAMKYALIEVFCVPTKDVEDSDRETPENGVRRDRKPVNVTKEDIEIGSARNVTGSEATKGSSSVVSAVASDKKRETSGEAPASEAEVVRQLKQDGYNATVPGEDAKPEFEGCIDKPRQIAFARAWAGACPVGIDKETARHQWLARRNYVDKDGIPTSAKIPLAIYEDEKRDAVNFARKLK